MIVAQRDAYPAASLIVKNQALHDALVRAKAEQETEEQQHQEQQQGAGGSVSGGAGIAACRGPGAARLLALLGPRLAECELFRHAFGAVRQRPPRQKWVAEDEKEEEGA